MKQLVCAATQPGGSPAIIGRVLAAGLLVVGTAAALPAQTAEQRRAIDAFGDSLRSIEDTSVLQKEEERLLDAAWLNRNDPFFHLRLAHLALRLGDLAGASHYDDAASEFKSAAQLAPRWPYAWFGVGLAELALGARAAGLDEGSVLARDAWSRASFAFSKAATLEPGFAARLEELASEALRRRAPARAGVIRDALLLAAGASGVPRLFLALGRVRRAMGDSLSLNAFESFLQVSDSSPLARLELGRTRLLYGGGDGFALYLAGASSDDPAAVQEYRTDLSPLATSAELADFDLRRGAARAEMIRRFWLMRDRLDFRDDGERLGEHLRRLAEARRQFMIVDALGGERLDDRGRIYVRHGPPNDRATLQEPGVEPNESWCYRRDGRDVLLHFVARREPGDFRLVESLLDISTVPMNGAAEDGAPGGLRAGLIDGSERLIRSRAALSSLYREAPVGKPDELARFLAMERSIGRRGLQESNTTDTYPVRYERRLDAWGTLVLGGAVNGEPRAQVLFAIPGYAVEPIEDRSRVVYPVRVRFAAFAENGPEAILVDSVVRIELPDRVAANRSLTGRMAVPLPPGRLIARAAVQYGDTAGSLFALDTLRVPDPGWSELDLGEPLIGSRRPQLPLAFDDGLSIALAPGGVVHRQDDLDLAVEVFGLDPGEEAELRVLLAPIERPELATDQALRWRPFPESGATARLRGRAEGPFTRWRVILPLRRVRAGTWALAVEAADPGGRVVRRVAQLTVQVP